MPLSESLADEVLHWVLDWVIDLDTQKFCDTLREGWPTLHRLRAESHHAQRAAPDKDRECFS
jgi:hypothetical protein